MGEGPGQFGARPASDVMRAADDAARHVHRAAEADSHGQRTGGGISREEPGRRGEQFGKAGIGSSGTWGVHPDELEEFAVVGDEAYGHVGPAYVGADISA